MYYLAFYLNYRPLLEEKIDYFISTIESDVFLYQNEISSLISKSGDLPIKLNDYSSNWIIYSSSNQIFSKVLLDFISGEKNCLKRNDDILSWFSKNLTWSIIPWGGEHVRFNSFVFISNDKLLRDLFINISSNIMDIEEIACIPKTNLLISKYDVLDKFSNSTQAIAFYQNKDLGNRIWNSCECDKNFPWIITFLCEEEDDIPCCWENANYQLVHKFNFATENQIGEQEIGVYQPNDIKSFTSMLKIHSSEPDTLMVVPNNTNIEQLKKLLSKTEGHPLYETFSYLSYLENILKTSNWLYIINSNFAGNGDYIYSLFVAKDSVLVRKIDELDLIDDYEAISYF